MLGVDFNCAYAIARFHQPFGLRSAFGLYVERQNRGLTSFATRPQYSAAPVVADQPYLSQEHTGIEVCSF